ncbi:acyl-CoA thioester hydrolase/BAAT C-terminal domain-containing protein [Embleya sp. MST-111070]|uniref:acyl-CoA thioester hydrolase/BAAT C-terminal domain-containing protein n=1 Tax=Embleya sp. MST-111070 TaxID=3398231 RepID=UPI003F73FA3D
MAALRAPPTWPGPPRGAGWPATARAPGRRAPREIAGADDQLWPSADAARAIVEELDDRGNPHPHRALVFPDAGHGVGTFPYLAAGTRYTYPVTKEPLDLGGTRAANAAAQARGWPRVLALLASLTR